MNIIAKLRARRDGDDEGGFTLIELMVVVLIIAILIAIAIPTFLGAQNKAKDRAAQSSLRNALTSAKTLYTDSSDYTTATFTALNGVEPSLTFQTAASTGPKMVSVSNAGFTVAGTPPQTVTGVDGIAFAARSASGTCFYLRDVATGPGTQFAASASGQASCDAAAPSLTGGVDWNGNGFTG
ncbi:MAG TPA: prepilin-type N-terminal cleavage/methylation domain-containing protein [Acidimicrobiia bacterium]